MKHLYYLSLLLCFSCFDYRDAREGEFNPSLLPAIDIQNVATARANGADTIAIKVSFPRETDSSITKVTLRTNGGVFFENDKQEITSTKAVGDPATNRKTITVLLKAPTSLRKVNLDIEVPGKFFTQRVLQLQPSTPNSIRVEASKFALQATYADEVLLVAYVRAQVGVPHEGTKVTFVVADSLSSDNNERHFRSVLGTNASGQASAIFSAGNLGGFRGRIPVVVRAQGNGAVLTDTFYLELIDPMD